jgi:hypothetical protein
MRLRHRLLNEFFGRWHIAYGARGLTTQESSESDSSTRALAPVSARITDEELAAYQKFPDTFFGVDKPHTKEGINDALDLYDWFLGCYSKTPKEILLGFLKTAPDFQTLQSLAQEELAATYCERLVYGIMPKSGPPQNYMTSLVTRVVAKASGK